MYLLNDGKTLEVSLDTTSAFSSPGERAKIIDRLRTESLPLTIHLARRHKPGPVEVVFLRDAMRAVHGRGGRVRIHSRNKEQAFPASA